MAIDLRRLLFVVFLAALSVFVVSFRLLDIFGVSPNLLLVFAFLYVYLPTREDFALLPDFSRFKELALFLGVFLLFALVIFNFWFRYALVFAGVIVFSYVTRGLLTGNFFLDYLLSVFVGTVIFYLASGLLFGTNLPLPVFLLEAAYNLFLGLLLWFAFRRLRVVG